jgi:phosphatidylglycerophosphatase A
MSAGASHQGRSPNGAARATPPSAPPPGPPPTTPPPANVVDRIAMLIASFGMTGFFPVAPATFASAITAVLLYFVLPLSVLAWLLLLGALLGIGVWSSGRLEQRLGQDPSAAVIDEVLGMAITMIAAPISIETLTIGFLLFRVFDVLKVWPGRRLERMHGGWGIMLDDVLAGIYAFAVLQILLQFWPDPQLQTWHLFVGAGLAAVLLVFRKPLFARFGKKRSSLSAALGKKQP